jgi:hypothetical protein
MSVMWNLILACLKTVKCQRKIGASFAPNVQQAQKSFWTHLNELLDDVHHVESCFGLFGDSVSVDAR